MPKNTKKFKQDPATAISSFSKNLLGLKFMQRAKKEVEKVAETKEDDASFDTSLCNKLKCKQQYIMNPSYQFCERLRFGRFSFKGMNTDIETIMFQNNPDQNKSQKRSAPPSEASSSDNEIDNLESNGEDDDNDDDVDDILEKIR